MSEDKTKKHIHKFIYPPPNGPESIGKCRCGEKKIGYNSMDGRFGSVWRKKNG
tara:strand:+ start:216 stop:374 length:159 start_codon:yes stop_codon:yes gene_type:complete